jgi:hypothetical protein
MPTLPPVSSWTTPRLTAASAGSVAASDDVSAVIEESAMMAAVGRIGDFITSELILHDDL